MTITGDPALSVFFSCDVDGVDLGTWVTCTGLGIEVETEPRTEGAMGFLMHQFSGRLKYTNLVLSRPVSADTAKVMTWLATFSVLPLTTSAEVKAYDTNGTALMTWDLFGVVPVRWTGPSFDAASLSVATETLELAYQGFL